MQKDREYTCCDIFYFEKRSFREITFLDEGMLSGAILDIDIVYSISGNWTVKKGDQLSLDWSYDGLMQTGSKNYEFAVSHPDTLRLFDEYTTVEAFENYNFMIPEGVVEQVRYVSVFVKK